MVLLTELHKNVINIAKGGGLPSDDTRLNSRLIKFWIRYYRSALIPEFTDFGKILYPELVQDLGCLTLSRVDKAECPATVTWGENISKVTIPSVVDLPFNRGLVFVGLADKQTPLVGTTPENAYWTQFRRFTANTVRYHVIKNDLYVVAPKKPNLCYVNVRAVFEDPTEIKTKDTNGNEVCFDESKDPYPIPETMIPKMIENIMAKELNLSLKSSFDAINDSLENPGQVRSTSTG